MGLLLSSLLVTPPSKSTDEARLLILGLPSAGKTTILYQFKFNELVATISTDTGINAQTIQYKDKTFSMWDIGGRINYGSLLSSFGKTDAIILVVDSANIQEFKFVKEELDRYLATKQLDGVPFLILANKQDLHEAVDVSDLAKALGIASRTDVDFFIHPCSAVTGEGLYQGLDWIYSTLHRVQQDSMTRE
ncbi:hypothetical protein FRB91_008631 [Serendipita sp. 411]|nr:hypothetical protein FRC18_006444 [Serendipita sp. 400]KAG8836485.1 hypothetical protein FRB91_008631 [Serendipita sp. 411]